MTDIVIVGGGIVGLSVAHSLTEAYPDLTIKVLEKETELGLHQTGRNSGVLHSGVFYQPGSMKARLARAGNDRMIRFCRENGIPHEICGKVVVAADDEELPALSRLMERAHANGIPVRRLSAEELREREPYVRGVAALHIPSAGIIDFGLVARRLAERVAAAGVELHLGTRLESIDRAQGEIRLGTAQGGIATRFLINCAGLYSDRIAEWDGRDEVNRALPFRGDYFQLRPGRSHLVRHLVYPVPDARFPFLGVHLTRTIHGAVHVGPNAVLSMAREGYGKTAFNFSEAAEMLRSNGFWGYARRHWRHGLAEASSGFNLKAFTRRLQRLVPDIQPEDLIPVESGVRTHAVTPEGTLVEDFQIIPGRNSLHICNAAAPAATASLEIGRHIAQRATQSPGFPAVGGPQDPWADDAPYCEGICEI